MNYCYVPVTGRCAAWYVAFWPSYVAFWPSNTTLSTLSDYANERGMKLYWDRDIRGLALR